MATTIQEILKPTRARALDTSGSNNHGQIYSGRALEFDGVTDYLNGGDAITSLILNNGNHTLVAWFNGSSFPSTYNYILSIGNNATGKQSSIGIKNDNTLFCSGYSSPIVATAATVEVNRWYRLVMVYTGGDTDTADFYLNGVFVEQESIALDVEVGKLRVGASLANSSIFTGMISDVQVWDAAWTADDALYDYNNPEQLALNNGGTSLTNSNLKVWYPMNDGHRGQQSYILDASNTGLGDELSPSETALSVTGSENSTTGWTNSSLATYEVVTDQTNGKDFALHCIASTDSDSASFSYTSNGKAGQTYKLTFDAKISNNASTSYLLIRGGTSIGNNADLDNNSQSSGFATYGNYDWNTYEFYFSASSTTVSRVITFREAGSGNDTEWYINNVSIKIVNDKNHATTVFYGDELITSDYANNGTFTTDEGGWLAWDPEGTSAVSIAHDDDGGNGGDNGGLKVTITGTSVEIQGAYLDTNYFETLVAGKTYRVSIDMKSGHPSSTDDYAISLGGTASANFNLTTSYATYTKDIIAASDADLLVYNTNAAAGRYFSIDNVSIKEIGTATGWTDADQQLNIPQTALQSYNQLAWFDGVADYVSIADHDDFTFADGPADSAFSISAWIYMNDATGFPIVCKDSTSHREYDFHVDTDDKLYFTLQDDSSGKQRGRAYNTAITSYEGQWMHVVGTYSGDESDPMAGIDLYINGEVVDDLDVTNTGIYAGMENKDGVVAIGAKLVNSKFANGAITEVVIWGTELSQAEVNELYNDGKALDATTHSEFSNIKAYYRNNGLSTWTNLDNPGTHDGSPTSLTETMLITAGADGSRDSQGFLMNRQRTTNSLNLFTNTIADGIGNGNRVLIPGRVALGRNDFSVSFWIYKRQSFDGQWVVSQFVDGNNRWYIRSNGDNMHLYARISSNIVFGDLDSTNMTTNYLNKWVHVVCAVDRNAEIKWYINGTNTSTGTVDGSGTEASSQEGVSLTLDADVTIGWDANTAFDDHHYNGEIDDLCIYSKYLTAAEAKRNYNAGKRSHR